MKPPMDANERELILNYLRITGLPIGVLLNFTHARLEWERLVLTKGPRTNAIQIQLEGADFQAAPQRP